MLFLIVVWMLLSLFFFKGRNQVYIEVPVMMLMDCVTEVVVFNTECLIVSVSENYCLKS